jgi:hypothetical protein
VICWLVVVTVVSGLNKASIALKRQCQASGAGESREVDFQKGVAKAG